ncbi:TROVE domain-containing protein [Streptomyces avicenniae]|uniref:TROVE domain-containing protein n=1 Tax=Streptomyces avicenniae TaxID=500153 RepID=UPI00069B7283|nr:TROVE domain-containing protein [Streptomyces avicenniae]
MARFNVRTARTAPTSPVTSTGARTSTYEGGSGHRRDARSELFLLAVANLVGQETFYEDRATRDDRYTTLLRQAAVDDPAWTAGLLGWLRGDANMRTAALVGAAEFAHARLQAGAHGHTRQAVASVLRRADEPGELLALWTARYGRAVPKPVKRGIADAVRALWTERSLLKYDTALRGFRFGDVLELTHPAPDPERPWQGDLFRHAIDRRHGRDQEIPARLTMLRARAELMAHPVRQRRLLVHSEGAAETLRRAGMTWEALAGWLQGPMDAAAWEAVIPSMGYMALLRNLRNFDATGVGDKAAEAVAARLADPEEVAASRQFPFRFLAAHREARSLRWAWPLERALGHATARVPALPGRTLVLVDRSGSMFHAMSEKTGLTYADAAAVFGTTVAQRAADADLVAFGTTSHRIDLTRGESALPVLERFGALGGTETAEAVRLHYRGHDRVLIVTDEQTGYGRRSDPGDVVPERVPLYTWNLVGYYAGHAPSGGRNRHTFGGLTDHAFRAVPLLEAGRSAAWPWEH